MTSMRNGSRSAVTFASSSVLAVTSAATGHDPPARPCARGPARPAFGAERQLLGQRPFLRPQASFPPPLTAEPLFETGQPTAFLGRRALRVRGGFGEGS